MCKVLFILGIEVFNAVERLVHLGLRLLHYHVLVDHWLLLPTVVDKRALRELVHEGGVEAAVAAHEAAATVVVVRVLREGAALEKRHI